MKYSAWHFPFSFVVLGCLLSFSARATQPEFAPLPDQLTGLPQELLVNHFDDPVFATTDADEKDTYLWKHSTAVISPFGEAEILKFGAYIYYNDQWNLRVEFKPRDFVKMFGCPKAQLKKGHPYTFAENWRRDERLRGGWAMWFFIARKTKGDTVAGVGKVYTVGSTYEEARYVLDPAQSSLKWTGHSAWTAYSPTGAIDFKSGELLLAENKLFRTEIEVDLLTLRSETGGIAEHLQTADFFDAPSFPTAKFTLTEAIALKEGRQEVEGKFSFHGASFTTKVPLEITAEGDRVTAKGTITLNRSNFGIDRSLPTKETKKTRQNEIADGFEVELEAVFLKE